MKSCFSCKKELNVGGRPARSETCPFCGSDVKVCLNCRFYDRDSYNDCSEPMAERVLGKDRSNFCEYFEFREFKEESEKEDAMKKLKDLFGDS